MRSCEALIIGGGPAGLMAADMLSAAGHGVLVADQKPSFGRKVLMAGKSGLNLTKEEDLTAFQARYDSDWLAPALSAFGPEAVKHWARDLGRDLFTGSTGRVFPREMKASPLLRAWLARLEGRGVEMRRRWRFTGWQDGQAGFETPEGEQCVSARVTVLALGGGSWARLGSDGRWADLPELAPACTPFLPSNTGLRVAWSAHMQPHFGKPIKAVRWCVRPGPEHSEQSGASTEIGTSRGEAILSERGLEGGGLYPLIPALRAAEARLYADLAPDLTEARLAGRIPSLAKGLKRALRNTLRWPPEKIAFFQEFSRASGAPPDADAVPALIKALPIRHAGLRPLDEAISTAGGLRRDALTEAFELRDRPGVFACGEMLDWDAPTGGYLLTACLATGHHAGCAARDRLKGTASPAR